jgi:hypothetical protein
MTLRLASLAQGRPRLASLAHPSTPLGMTLSLSKGQGRARLRFVAACTVAFVISGGSSSLLACPMCFGAEETSLVDGTKLGIVAMLAITIAVQGAFLGFFLYLRKTAKRAAEIELDTEWSELQKTS